jgi:hypothetical protein
MKPVFIVFIATSVLLINSCVVRTVTDEGGNVIYQEPELHTPFESESKRQAEVMEKERELGW